MTTWRDPFQPFASLTTMFPIDTPEDEMWNAVEREMLLLAMGQALGEEWRSGS